MSESRKHHFIPMMTLRRFTDARSKLHVFDKRRASRGVFATNPINVFVERDLNSRVDTQGTINVALETFYSELESGVTPIIEKIVSAAMCGNIPSLNSQEKEQWGSFLYYQHKRAPDIYSRLGLDLDASTEEATSLAIRDAEKHWGNAPIHVLERVFSEREQARLKQNISVDMRRKENRKITELIASKGIAVGVIPNDNWSFIVGDHPLARMGATSDLHQATTELWMPKWPFLRGARQILKQSSSSRIASRCGG